jgi:hypothetical protein
MSADLPEGASGLPEAEELGDISPEALELELVLRAHAHELSVSSQTVDLLLSDATTAAAARVVPVDESRSRVRSLLAMERADAASDVAAMMRSRREDAHMKPQAGASELGIAEGALLRIEEGAVAVLLNLDATRVASYLGRISMDPTIVVRAALRVSEQQSPWGYTPGDHGEGRPQAQFSRASQVLDPHDRDWIETFLRSWGARANGGASRT